MAVESCVVIFLVDWHSVKFNILTEETHQELLQRLLQWRPFSQKWTSMGWRLSNAADSERVSRKKSRDADSFSVWRTCCVMWAVLLLTCRGEVGRLSSSPQVTFYYERKTIRRPLTFIHRTSDSQKDKLWIDSTMNLPWLAASLS